MGSRLRRTSSLWWTEICYPPGCVTAPVTGPGRPRATACSRVRSAEAGAQPGSSPARAGLGWTGLDPDRAGLGWTRTGLGRAGLP